eukprot:4874618-Amphidinium_carterae.2
MCLPLTIHPLQCSQQPTSHLTLLSESRGMLHMQEEIALEQIIGIPSKPLWIVQRVDSGESIRYER